MQYIVSCVVYALVLIQAAVQRNIIAVTVYSCVYFITHIYTHFPYLCLFIRSQRSKYAKLVRAVYRLVQDCTNRFVEPVRGVRACA